jgi:outer membrane murein-binding lipoprotein Lpp
MATQTVVDAITKALTDNGYTAPADVSQLSAEVDTFTSTAGFTAADEDDTAEQAQVAGDESAIAADKADEASKQADEDSVNAAEAAEDKV